jgi:hypothetical protein
MTDTERIDWLEKQFGCGLINDDNGHWAVSGSGTQNVPSGDDPEDIASTFFVDASEWKPTVREAIDAAYAEWEADDQEETMSNARTRS